MFWAFVFLVLGSLFAAAQGLIPNVGFTPDKAPLAAARASLSVPSPVDVAAQVQARLSQLPVVAVPPYSGLAEWAAGTATMAREMAAERVEAGKSSSDSIVVSLGAVARAADELARVAPTGDTMQIRTAAAQLGMAGDALVATVGGIPASVPSSAPVPAPAETYPTKPGQEPAPINPADPTA